MMSDEQAMSVAPSKSIPRQAAIRYVSLKWIFVIGIVAAAWVVPWLTKNSSLLNLLFLIFLFIALSQSWNILAGFVGQISLGHAAFFGIGALVMRTLWLGGMDILIAMPVAGAAAALCALVVGVP